MPSCWLHQAVIRRSISASAFHLTTTEARVAARIDLAGQQ
jgi:hypothetical protein